MLSCTPRRLGVLLLAIPLCFGLSGCKTKITKANADKIAPGMTEEEVTKILGKPTDTVEGGGEVGGLGGMAGVDMPATSRLPKGVKIDKWESGNQNISITFKDGVVTKKDATGF